MTLIIQQLIKVVPINMHLMFTLNHTSKACLFKQETSQSLLWWFYQVHFVEILPLLFWICITHFSCLLPGYHAQRQRRRETRNCSQSSGCCYSRQDLRIHSTALGFPLLSVWVRALHQSTATSSTKSRQPKAGVTLQWTRPLTSRWKISEHQILL